jgi:hypothetical protein
MTYYVNFYLSVLPEGASEHTETFLHKAYARLSESATGQIFGASGPEYSIRHKKLDNQRTRILHRL